MKNFILILSSLVLLTSTSASVAHEETVFLNPKTKKSVRTRYPHTAVINELCGVVYVRVTVDETGRVKDYSLLKAYPVGVFEAAVEIAIKQFEFDNYAPDGTPAPYQAMLPFKFIIEQEKHCKNGPLPGLPGE